MTEDFVQGDNHEPATMGGFKIGDRVMVTLNQGEGNTGTVSDLDVNHGWRLWVRMDDDGEYKGRTLYKDPDDLDALSESDGIPAIRLGLDEASFHQAPDNGVQLWAQALIASIEAAATSSQHVLMMQATEGIDGQWYPMIGFAEVIDADHYGEFKPFGVAVFPQYFNQFLNPNVVEDSETPSGGEENGNSTV